MLQALVFLALAMIGAGGYAVYSGADYVVLETGLALVVGGSVCASAGAVLLGICALMREVRTLRQAQTTIIAQASLLNGAAETGEFGGSPGSQAPSEPVFPPVPQPFAAEPAPHAMAGSATLPIADAAPPSDMAEGGPAPEVEPVQASGAEQVIVETSRVAETATFTLTGPDADQMERELAAAAETQAELPAESSSDAAGDKALADHDPGESPPTPAPEALDEVPTVVGSYASEGHTYVMYSDGSIEADTPSGVYRFASLDELKAFIAAGGIDLGRTDEAGDDTPRDDRGKPLA